MDRDVKRLSKNVSSKSVCSFDSYCTTRCFEKTVNTFIPMRSRVNLFYNFYCIPQMVNFIKFRS
jgi:hypothetical protein